MGTRSRSGEWLEFRVFVVAADNDLYPLPDNEEWVGSVENADGAGVAVIAKWWPSNADDDRLFQGIVDRARSGVLVNGQLVAEGAAYAAHLDDRSGVAVLVDLPLDVGPVRQP